MSDYPPNKKGSSQQSQERSFTIYLKLPPISTWSTLLNTGFSLAKWLRQITYPEYWHLIGHGEPEKHTQTHTHFKYYTWLRIFKGIHYSTPHTHYFLMSAIVNRGEPWNLLQTHFIELDTFIVLNSLSFLVEEGKWGQKVWQTTHT